MKKGLKINLNILIGEVKLFSANFLG